MDRQIQLGMDLGSRTTQTAGKVGSGARALRARYKPPPAPALAALCTPRDQESTSDFSRSATPRPSGSNRPGVVRASIIGDSSNTETDARL